MSLSSESDLKKKLKHMRCLNNTNDDTIIANLNWGRTITEERLYPKKKYKTKVIVLNKNICKKTIIKKDIKKILMKNRLIFFKIFKDHNLDSKIQNKIIKEFIKSIYLRKYNLCH